MQALEWLLSSAMLHYVEHKLWSGIYILSAASPIVFHAIGVGVSVGRVLQNASSAVWQAYSKAQAQE